MSSTKILLHSLLTIISECPQGKILHSVKKKERNWFNPKSQSSDCQKRLKERKNV